jgi:hypothetical protein
LLVDGCHDRASELGLVVTEHIVDSGVDVISDPRDIVDLIAFLLNKEVEQDIVLIS